MDSKYEADYHSQEGNKIQSRQQQRVITRKLANHDQELAELKQAREQAEEAAKQSRETFEDFKIKYKETKDELKENKSLLIVGFIVLLVIVAGLLLDSLRGKESAAPIVVNNYLTSPVQPGDIKCTQWSF